MSDFDPERALAKLRENNRRGGRKLSFVERCAAFAALYGGAKNMDVSRAFNLSPTSTSYLSGCLNFDPFASRTQLAMRDGAVVEEEITNDHNQGRNPNRRSHYPDVAREFEALGETEFNKRYYTIDVHNRIIEAHNAIVRERGRVPFSNGEPQNSA
jgi:hypothetical protein